MVTEYVYCAVNSNDEIVTVEGSSQKTRYYKTDTYLKRAIKYHNQYHPNDPWRIAKFLLVEVEREWVVER